VDFGESIGVVRLSYTVLLIEIHCWRDILVLGRAFFRCVWNTLPLREFVGLYKILRLDNGGLIMGIGFLEV